MNIKNVESIYPLSPIQEALLRRSINALPEEVNYCETVYDIQGKLDVEIFERAWQSAVERNALLRTSFVWKRVQKTVQVVYKQVSLQLRQEACCLPTALDAEAKLAETPIDSSQIKLDLGQAPLMGLNLMRADAGSHQLVWRYHPIILDEPSAALILEHVLTCYGALVRGDETPDQERRPFQEYINWYKQQEPERAELYWRAMFEGWKGTSSLSEQRLNAPQAPCGLNTFRRQAVSLSKNTREAFTALAEKYHLTEATIVEGAWAILLGRYGCEDEALFGVTCSGRPHGLDGADSMLGPLVNTLPIRVRLRPEESVIEFLQRLEAGQSEARQFQYCSPEQIQTWSGLPPDLLSPESRFETLDRPADVVLEHDGVPLRVVRRSTQTPGRPPLNLRLLTQAEFKIEMDFDSRVYDDATIERMLSHLQTIVGSMIEKPLGRLHAVAILDEAERLRLLESWNDTATNYPKEQCIHELFEAQAERTPQAISLTYGAEKLTYDELNRRANQLAHYLRANGVGPEVLVGVMSDRSPQLIIGLLAILKAGGAYVPLDVHYPQSRLDFMLQDTKATILLAQERMLEKLSEYERHVVCLDSDWETFEHYPDVNLSGLTKAGNLAYVMYTSGSTGKPKGVEVSHRSVIRLLVGVDYVQLDAEQRVLQLAPISFDASTFEIWGALLHGGRSVLFPEKIPAIEELGALLHEEQVSTLWLTSSLYNTVVNEKPKILAGVGQLLIGGEALSAMHVERGLRELSSTQIINGYGPTEGTTFTCCYPIPRQKVINSIPIGRPISNTRVYLLDQHMRLVPAGVCGELYIGGDGLARGYLSHPELTAEKFVPDPFGVEPGARLYKTGDRVRYLPDGRIEFHGRFDEQVKIRGFRIEPGEIEAVLSQHKRVRDGVVVVREAAPGEKRLVAYVVAEDAELPPSSAELRDYLAERLPEHMIPTAFVTLDALPLTINGKLDRRALPAPELSPAEAESGMVSARTPTEEMLTGIWLNVLGIEHAGISDNFFGLGGHSLLAAQVISRVRETFQIDLPVRTLFERPTIEGLAESIDAAIREGNGLTALPIRPVSRDGALPLSYAQQRLWFIDQLEPGDPTYNVPIAVRLTGQLDCTALKQTLTELVRRHEVLRTTFDSIAGRPAQIIAPPEPVRLTLIDLSALPDDTREEEARQLSIQEMQRGFDLKQGPLLRASMLRLAAEEHVILLALHHIVSDGWSIDVLVREVGALYEAFSANRPSPLPELEIQYADYACWQREYLQGETLERELSYWRKQLAGELEDLQLPADRPRPAAKSSQGAHESFNAPAELSAALRKIGLQEGATFFMTLLAAFQTLLHRYSGQEDIVVGTNSANRNRKEIEGLIGFFVNNLVLRTRVSGELSFRQLLGRVREVVLGAYQHQELPFDKLVEALHPSRKLNQTPLFQVVFTLQNASVGNLDLPGLTLNAIPIDKGTAKYDLVFNMGESVEGISGYVEYNTDMFERATIKKMLGHFERLLQSIVAQPEAPINSLNMLSQEERLFLDRPVAIEELNESFSFGA